MAFIAEVNTSLRDDKKVSFKLVGFENILIDWGDGVVDGLTEHVYANDGVYEIKVECITHERRTFSAANNPLIVKIKDFGDTKAYRFAFENCVNLELVPTTLPISVTNMDRMFSDCSKFNQDLNTWEVSRVTSMVGTFQNAYKFNGALNTWNVSAVKDMSYMFRGASSFDRSINNWQVLNVESMAWMFDGAKSFNKPLNSWNVMKVKNMTSMFNDASSFNQNLNNWVLSSVTSMMNMFRNARSFNGDISSWNTMNVTNMAYMFANAQVFNRDISGWNVANVTTMQGMFSGARAFNQDISSWAVVYVEDMNWMFKDAATFNQDLSVWCVSYITEEPHYFSTGASSWTNDKPVWGTCPISGSIIFEIDGSRIENNPGGTVPTLLSFDNSVVRFNYRDTTNNISGTVDGWRLESELLPSAGTIIVDKIIRKSSGVFNLSFAFNKRLINVFSYEDLAITGLSFNSCTKLVSVPDYLPETVTSLSNAFHSCNSFNDPNVVNWNTRNVTNMSGIFRYNEIFNQPIGTWDTSNVTNLSYAFSGVKAFKQDINNWNTSKVTNLSYTFAYSNEFNQPLNKWDVSKVTDLSSTFLSCYKFNQPLNNWDTSSVTSLASTFQNAYAFNQPLDKWVTYNVTSLYATFYNAKVFNQDISGWDTSKVTNIILFAAQTNAFDQNLLYWDLSNTPMDRSAEYRWQTNWRLPPCIPGAKIERGDMVLGLTEQAVSPTGVLIDLGENVESFDLWFNGTASADKYYSRFVTKVNGSKIYSSYILGTYGATATTGHYRIFNVKYKTGKPNSMDLIAIDATIQEIYAFGKEPINKLKVTPTQPYVYNSYGGTIGYIDSELPSSVVDLSNAFENMYSAYEVTRSNIGSWDVSNVTNMDRMFNGYRHIHDIIDLSNWCVTNITEEPIDFYSGAYNRVIKPIWGTCPNG